MTATSVGVVYLVEGVTLSPMTSSSVSFSGENLDHVGRTTAAPLRRSLAVGVVLKALAGDGRLLFSERIRFCACLCLVPLHPLGRVGRRLAVLCRCSTLADALPLYCFGGCFAAVVVGESSLRADALPPILVGRVDALPPYLCCGSSHLWRCSFFCRFSCWLVLRRSWLGL